MAEWLMYKLAKHKDLSADPQNPCESRLCGCTSVTTVLGRVDTQILRTYCSATLIETVSSRLSYFLAILLFCCYKNNMYRSRGRQLIQTLLFHVCPPMKNTSLPTHTHEHTCKHHSIILIKLTEKQINAGFSTY